MCVCVGASNKLWVGGGFFFLLGRAVIFSRLPNNMEGDP